MQIIYELSWLWTLLGIALAAAAVCVAAAALIARFARPCAIPFLPYNGAPAGQTLKSISP